MTNHQLPLTDSPWFWVLLFSCVALAALAVVERKYGRRQAQLERQFQGRQWAQQHRVAPGSAARPDDAAPNAGNEEPLSGGARTGDEPPSAAPGFSTADDTLVKLWPLRIAALLLIGLSAAMLMRRARSVNPASRAGP